MACNWVSLLVGMDDCFRHNMYIYNLYLSCGMLQNILVVNNRWHEVALSGLVVSCINFITLFELVDTMEDQRSSYCMMLRINVHQNKKVMRLPLL